MKQGEYRFSLAGRPHYPFLHLTAERFPRLIATRSPEAEGKYFGPFLDRTAVRLLIDLMNRTFRLRTCAIEIDGKFNVPCVQFYHRRCLGPCVAELCGEAEYLEASGLAELFLNNDRHRFLQRLESMIERHAQKLDFEQAAGLRDIGIRADAFWNDKRLSVWLDDAVDTMVLESSDEETTIYIVTQRKGRTLGMRIYTWPFVDPYEPTLALSEVLKQFYRRHTPREIRISHEIPDRAETAAELSERVGRKVSIRVVAADAQQITTRRLLFKTKREEDLGRLAAPKTPVEIAEMLSGMFGLARPPYRIEAFDAAHISGTVPTAARSVWIGGRFDAAKSSFTTAATGSEIDVLATFVENSIAAAEEPADLIIVDGGQAHLNAVRRRVDGMSGPIPKIVGAVKPPDDHSSIAYFLIETGEKIAFDADNQAMRVLKLLRDEAHALANYVHGEARDMAHFYELAAILPSLTETERLRLRERYGSIRNILAASKTQLESVLGVKTAETAAADIARSMVGDMRPAVPLVVPIFYADPNGMANDLRPIDSRSI